MDLFEPTGNRSAGADRLFLLGGVGGVAAVPLGPGRAAGGRLPPGGEEPVEDGAPASGVESGRGRAPPNNRLSTADITDLDTASMMCRPVQLNCSLAISIGAPLLPAATAATCANCGTQNRGTLGPPGSARVCTVADTDDFSSMVRFTSLASCCPDPARDNGTTDRSRKLRHSQDHLSLVGLRAALTRDTLTSVG